MLSLQFLFEWKNTLKYYSIAQDYAETHFTTSWSHASVLPAPGSDSSRESYLNLPHSWLLLWNSSAHPACLGAGAPTSARFCTGSLWCPSRCGSLADRQPWRSLAPSCSDASRTYGKMVVRFSSNKKVYKKYLKPFLFLIGYGLLWIHCSQPVTSAFQCYCVKFITNKQFAFSLNQSKDILILY